jgi:iron(III) transport system substrate-binding protein
MTATPRGYLASALLAAIVSAPIAVAPGPQAAEPTAAEKLYAELFKLPAAERQKRIEEGTKKEGNLIFTYSVGPAIGNALNKDMEKQYPWFKYSAQQISDPVAMDRLVSEEKAGRHLTDSLNGSITTLMVPLQLGLLAVYPTPATDRILPQYKSFLDKENRWVPKMWSEHGISYNPDMIKPEDAPKNFMDLCNPKLSGQVSFDPLESRFADYIFMVFDRDMKKTEEWMKCMGANKPIIMRGHTQRVQLMLAGDHGVQGDNFLYQGVMLNQKNPKKAPFVPVYGEVILAAPSVTVINKNTPHPYGAALYVDYLLSDGAQQVFKESFRGPLTLPHPYMPTDVRFAVQGLPDEKEMDQLYALWRKYVDGKTSSAKE